MRITPWEVEGIVDYDKLIREFGIEPFSKIIEKIPNPHWLMRRGVIFGHRDYERIIDAIMNKEPWAVMSGFMPSGLPHFGHKMTMDEIIWHQSMGGKAFIAIADMEAHGVRGLSWDKTREIGYLYIKSIIALGLKPDDAIIYFQSANRHVKDLAFELSSEVNWSELKAIYGFSSETTLAKMFVTSIQAADILHPQLKEFGGPKPVVVPVGADQDPHLRLTRDLAARVSIFSFERIEGGVRIRSRKGSDYLKEIKKLGFECKTYAEHIDVFGDPKEIEKEVRNLEVELGGFAFIPPSSTYHRFMTGLTGGKMSSSKPESYISLLDKPEEGAKKVMRALTGGRVSAEEQRRLGGEPEKCTVFELFTYHLILDDDELEEVRRECKEGGLLCGQCKKRAAELIKTFLKEHQEKMDSIDLNDYYIIS
ncbi:MAG TPA: tryptophan--tRNA ligase [Archaeoglobus profundus]|nr:tryptophan--tRNA ligase [Archaeoglobus profundus]